MRKSMIALLFAATLPTLAMAAPMGGPPHDGPGPRHHGPYAELNLSAEQRQQIGQLMGDQMKQRRDLTERYLAKLSAADQKAMQDEIKADKAKTDSQVRALLKPEQQTRFDTLQKERAERKAEWQAFQQWKAEKAAKTQ